MTKCPAMHSFSGLKTSVGCMISLALLPLGVGGHAEMTRAGCPLTSLSLLPPQRGQIWEMPVLYGLGQQQLSTCCSACRGAQRLPGGYSCSTPSTWAKKNPGAVGATLAEARSDSFTCQKSPNLSKFERRATLDGVW